MCFALYLYNIESSIIYLSILYFYNLIKYEIREKFIKFVKGGKYKI